MDDADQITINVGEGSSYIAAARPYYERALAIFEGALGPEHPNTRIVRKNLAYLLAQL